MAEIAVNVGSVSVDIVPNALGFQAKLDAAVRNATVKVNLDLVTNGIQEKIDAATKGRTVKVDVDVVGDKVAAAKVAEAAKDQTAKVDVKVEGEKQAKAKVDDVAKDQTAKVKLDVEGEKQAKAKVKALQADLEALNASLRKTGAADRLRLAQLAKEMDREKSRFVNGDLSESLVSAARFVKLREEHKDLRLKLNLDTAGLRKEIARVQTALNQAKVSLGVEVDDARAQAQLEKLEAKRKVELQAEVNKAHAEAAIEELTRKKRRREIYFVADVDVARAMADLEQLRRDHEVTYTVNVARAHAEATLERLTRAREIYFVVDVDEARALADLEQLSRDREAKYTVNVNKAHAEAILEDLKRTREAHFVVDIDDARAQADLENLQRTREARIKARAEIARAEAELDRVARDRTANLRLSSSGESGKKELDDTARSASTASGFIAALIAVGAGIGPAIVPAAGAAAAAIAAIGPAALIGVGGIGVLVGGLRGVVGAVSAATKAQTAQQVAAYKSANTQVASASRIASAQDALKGSEMSLANVRASAAQAAVHAARQVADAQAGVAQASKDAAAGVQRAIDAQVTAEHNLQVALLNEKEAQQSLSQARQQAKRDIEDLTNSLADGQLTQRQAALDVQTTYDALVASQDSGSRLEREQAQLAYDRAVQAQKEAAQNQGRLVNQQKTAQQNGIEGSPGVVAALKAVTDAKYAVAQAKKDAVDATKAIAAARIAGAQQIAKAEQALGDAVQAQADQRRQSAYSIAQAQRGVTSAQRALNDATDGSATATGAANTALAEAKQKMAALTPEGRALALMLSDQVVPGFQALQKASQSIIAPGALAGLRAASPIVGPLTGLVHALATGMSELFREAGQALGSPFWVQFTNFLAREAAPTLEGYGHVIGNVLKAVAGLGQAFGPLGDAIRTKLISITDQFANFGTGKTGGLAKFVAYVNQAAPLVSSSLGAIARAAGHIVEAIAPLGERVLSVLKSFSEQIANIPIKTLSLVVSGLVLVVAAVATLNASIAVITAFKMALGFVVTGGIGPVLAGVLLLVPALVALFNHFGPLHELVANKLVPAFKTAGDFLRDRFTPVLRDISQFVLNSVVPALSQFGTYLVNTLLPILGRLVRDALTGFTDALSYVKTAIGENHGAFAAFITDVTDIVKSIVGLLLPAVGPILREAFRLLGAVIGIAVDALGGILKAIDALKVPLFVIGGSILAFKAALKGLEIAQMVSQNLTRISNTLKVLGDDLTYAGQNAQIASGKFGRVGPAVTKGAGGALKGLGAVTSFLGGPWGIAIGLGVTAIGGLALAHYQAKKASQAFVDQLTFENGALDENSRVSLASQLGKDGTLKSVAQAGVSTKEYTKALIEGGAARQAMLDHLRQIQHEGEHYVTVGGQVQSSVTEQSKAAGIAADAMGTYGTSLDQNADSATRADEALGKVAGSADQASTSVRDYGTRADEAAGYVDSLSFASGQLGSAQDQLKAAQDRVAAATQAEIDNFTILRQGALDSAEASMRVNTSFLNFSETVKQNGTSLADNTKKGMANRQGILDSVKAVNEKITADFKHNESTKGMKKALDIASGALGKNKKALEDAAVKAGYNRGEVHKMLAEYTLTPDELKTNINLTNAKKAKEDVKRLQDQIKDLKKAIDDLKSKIVTINFESNAQTFADQFAIGNTLNGGEHDASTSKSNLAPRARGGIVGEGKARGGILPGDTPLYRGDDIAFPMARGGIQPLRGGEGIIVTEAMRDPYERARLFAVNKAALRGENLGRFREPGLKNGGIVRTRDIPVPSVSTGSNLGFPDFNALGTAMGDALGNKLGKALGKSLDKQKAAFDAKQAAASSGASGSYSSPGGSVRGFNGEQLKNAATIASVGSSMGAAAQKIGIAAAIVESSLRNLSGGDRDSVGLFQQRRPWGTFAQRHNPKEASRMFFHGGHGGQRGLDDIKGWKNMSPGAAAQAVEVSAFPGRYSGQMSNAAAILKALKHSSGGGGSAGANSSQTGKRVWPTNTHALSGNYAGHSGVDIRAGEGAPIWANIAGTISYQGWNRGFGHAIFEKGDNGLPIVYGHGSKVFVKAGQHVKAGQRIGNVGHTGHATGPHLHFEIAPDGRFGKASNRPKSLNWLNHGKYDNGGWLQPGTTVVHNETGKPEPVLNPSQWKLLEKLANGGGGRRSGPMVNVEKIETADARGVASALEAQWALRDALYPSWS